MVNTLSVQRSPSCKMLKNFKIISYSLIILLALVLHRQAAAQCNAQDACEAAATSQGLELGGAGYDFVGGYKTKGCYSYESGKYQGRAYFGTGGTDADMAAEPSSPKYRIDTTGFCEGSGPDQAITKEINAKLARCKTLVRWANCIFDRKKNEICVDASHVGWPWCASLDHPYWNE